MILCPTYRMKKIIDIPAGQKWPVIGRDKKTGELMLRDGFMEAVADASGLSLPWHGEQKLPHLTEDMIARLLIEWYFKRQREGEQADTVIESYILEVLHEHIPSCRCLRCGHGWSPRVLERSRICPKCKSPYWNKPRQILRGGKI